LTQSLGRPGDAPAVVAVGGRSQGDLPDTFAHSVAHQLGIGHLAQRPVQLLTYQPGHRVTASQNLEGFEAKAGRFILDEDVGKSPGPDQTLQPDQWGGFVTRQLAVEGPDPQGRGG
jgi:hypothetical protein